ncbi:MAG: PilZ domain-containing protein [Pseudomonadales bacterium]|nr:PilZ domain-containing protein [Pseudomonadales bacterium]
MNDEFQERRKHPRIDVSWAIYIEVVGRGSRTEADNVIVRCETVDVSVGGLKIWVPEPIAQGSQLNIAVPMDDWKENLELAGRVMWTRAADDGKGFWLGLELADSSHDDMRKWYEAVQHLQSHAPMAGP